MKLQTLELENFQGIKQADFCFNGQSATIYGDNATGKTTVFNALTWLLFDKASTGAKGFTPKTRTANGDAHNLNHSATATFIMDDGRYTSFTKTFHEIYKKKKGSATSEFSGHTTDYFIDGVPVKEREYQDTLLRRLGYSWCYIVSPRQFRNGTVLRRPVGVLESGA